MDETKRWMLDVTLWVAALFTMLALLAHEAMAGGNLATPPNERWKTECGSCHVPYPPQLLPAQSWKRVMSGLDRHFGTDASVEPAAAAEIAAYLERHAGSGRRAPAATGTLRITDTAWFTREHRKVPAPTWKLAAVKSAANCAACHSTAEQGDFRERNIRLPH